MFIKSIILDGFKSYGRKTEIKGFDTQFNAITGLNGSGKSNILDAICFVLGITNLSNVRAMQLQDLVYKNGQAGIVKASVSITFDNGNKSQCPPGYEDMSELVITRQVVIDGKNKYFINGTQVTNKRIQDLFCSVQLNVNNPNFLIMQGRVTKVLNMKPVEILAMIEEAAGTRMFDAKRIESERNLQKNEAKIQSLNSLIYDDVLPRLNKLKKDREEYMQYQNLEREIDRATHIWIAWRCLNIKKELEAANDNVKKIELNIENKTAGIENNNLEIKNIEENIKKINVNIDKESGGKLKSLRADLKEKETEEAKVMATVNEAKVTITREKKQLTQIEKRLENDQKTLTSKKNALAKVESSFTTLKEREAADLAALEAAQKRFDAASVGKVVGEDGVAVTLQEQLIAARQEETALVTKIETSEMDLKYAKDKLKEKETQLKNCHFEDNQNALQEAERNINVLNRKRDSLKFDENAMTEMKQEYNNLRGKVANLRASVERFEANYPRASFTYRDPQPNFNRSKVHGLVCKLFTVKDPQYFTAIETVAGGRLYNVIVDNNETAKLIIQKGQLKVRTTMIPLKDILGQKMKPQVIQHATKLVGSDKVKSALSLISFDPKLTPAMEFIFGNTLICSDVKVGVKLAFDPQIRKRCVTLEGDVVDPDGVLSGGAATESGTLLSALHSTKALLEDFESSQIKLEKLGDAIRNLQPKAEQYDTLNRQLFLENKKLETLQQDMQQTTYYQLKTSVEQLKSDIKRIEEEVKQYKVTHKQILQKIKDIEKQLNDSVGRKEKELKAAQAEMDRCEKQAEKSKNEWKKKEQEFNTMNMEITAAQQAVDDDKEQQAEAIKAIAQAQEAYNEIEKELNKVKELVAEVQSKINEAENEIAIHTNEIQQMLQRKQQLNDNSNELKLKIQELTHELKEANEVHKNIIGQEKKLLSENDWMNNKNDQHFVKSAVALSTEDAHQLQNDIKHLKAKHHELGRRVSNPGMSLLEKEEVRFKDCEEKKRNIEKDKAAIMTCINKTQTKKQQALQLAWEQVNSNFGSIFGTLLSGADAKLQIPTGKTLLEGLEVKVSFGGVWKESLGELSGGQRSLVALSLILAMLLYKPAPIYILDEVDAALDLSHTQNIGKMLKSHFKHSQFVIVSLKDGMFNNANVLFRTNFEDGVSSVQRTANVK